MKTDKFVKVMLLTIAGVLLLNCNKSNTENISSNIKTEPPRNISEALINDAKKHCQTKKWECQGFKIDQYNEADLSDADIANDLAKKGGLMFPLLHERIQCKSGHLRGLHLDMN